MVVISKEVLLSSKKMALNKVPEYKKVMIKLKIVVVHIYLYMHITMVWSRLSCWDARV